MGKNYQQRKNVVKKTDLGRALFKSRFNKSDEFNKSERWVS